MKRTCLAFLAAVLCLASVPAARAAAAVQTSGIDMVFLVDNSPEMGVHDPGNSRLQLLHSLIDLSRDRGAQRLAVLRLSRQSGAGNDDRVQLPLTPIPEDLASSWQILDRAIRPAFDGLGSDGDALTIIDNFQRLEGVLGDRGTPAPPLWIVLVTNGDADPLGKDGDSGDVPDDVMARATELAEAQGRLSAKRDNIKDAAKEIIPTAIPPLLSALGDTVVLTIVNVEENVDREPVLDRLANAASGLPVLDLDGTNVRDVAVDAIAQAPFPPRRDGVLTRELDGDADRQNVRILQGTRSARILLQADHGDYTATLRRTDGGSASFQTSSPTSPVRSLVMAAPPPTPGEYELVIENRGDDLDLDVQLEFDLDIREVITAPDSGTTHAVGDEIALGVRLEDASGNVLSDPFLLDGGYISAAWAGPAGATPGERWDISGDAEYAFAYAHNDVTNGAANFSWSAEAGLLPDGSGGYEWTMAAREGSVSTEFSMPSIRFVFRDADDGVEFESSGAGGALAFLSDYVSGQTTQRATLGLEVDLHGMPEIPVEVSFAKASGFGTAEADGKASSLVRIDGTEVGAGTQLVFDASTAGEVTIEMTKSGFGPFSEDAGELVAIVTSGGVEHGRATVDLSMGPRIGLMTLLSLLALLLLLILLAFLVLMMKRRGDWKRRLAALGDDDVLYFDDDELAAAS